MADTIYTAISKAQGRIKAAYKSGDNKFDRYQYAKLEDFMDAAKPILADLGLSLVCSVTDLLPLEDRTTKGGGTEHAVRVKVLGTLYYSDGTKIEVCCFGEGQDRADKAIYKAITGAKKYLIASLLQIPTTDDPEADETVGQSPAAAAKVDATTGEVKKAQPKWTDEQRAEIGHWFAAVIQGVTEGERLVNEFRAKYKYTEPVEVIRLCKSWCKDLGVEP
jgi:hypothetical protein